MSTAVLENQPDVEVVQSHDPQQPKRRFRWQTWGAIGVALLALLSVELVFRVAGTRLSKDIAHLKSFEQLSLELASSPETPKVLFLGNSLTRYGVNQSLYMELVVETTGNRIATQKVNPDNTALADWYYAYQHYFERKDRQPDVLIIGFEGGHLRDAPSIHLDRLAHYYCDCKDMSDIALWDARSFEDRLYFYGCRISSALANRDRIQRRALDKLIPNYRDGMQDLNSRLQQELPEGVTFSHSYDRLQKLIETAEAKSVRVILAAMPVPEHYEFDQELLDLVESTNAELVDCREVPSMKLEMFFDGLHMDEAGSALYTKTLVEKTASLLPYPQTLAQGANP